MYIIEIILDGFKSYQQLTRIMAFDPQFNAITGLNGSGKSNIFDAICFLMGITSLHNVRVSNLKELIYKSGNSGITKATVTIVFDNTDKKRSPPGYAMEDELRITRSIEEGKTKYTINGKTETTEKIKNLFLSVSLNINNPHFMVQQGRISQTLNLSPTALMALVEEASGTTLYERKKEASIKLIQKKNAKVQEINGIFLSEIEPQLEKLQADRQNLVKWRENDASMTKLWKQIVAFEYWHNDKLRNAKSGEIERLKIEGDRLLESLNLLKNTARECEDTF